GSVTLGTVLPSASRYIRVDLPAGIQLGQMLNGTPSPQFSVTLSDGRIAYYWLLSALAPDASHTLSFNISAAASEAECGNRITLRARTVMRNLVGCSTTGQNCEMEATTASDLHSLSIQGECCECIASFAPLENHKYVLSA